ncbi:MAG: lipoate protein ligase C-terminal domain-containing protein [Candidatus Humimicrobiaceae bacterium]
MADVKIFGDFFSKKDVGLFEKSLINVKHNESSLKNALAAIKTTNYFLNFTESEILSLFF